MLGATIMLLANIRAVGTADDINHLEKHAQQLAKVLNQKIDLLVMSLERSANSRLMLQALESLERQQTQMISLYLDALSPAGLTDLPIVLVDREGQILHANQSSTLTLKSAIAQSFYSQQLNRAANTLVKWHNGTLRIAVPQHTPDSAKSPNTLTTQLNAQHIQQLLADLPSEPQFLILDNQNKIQHSPKPSLFKPGDTLESRQANANWRFDSTIPLPLMNAQLIAFEKNAITPLSKKLTPILIVALSTVLLTMLGTVLIAGRIVTQSVNALTNTMSELTQKQLSGLSLRAQMGSRTPKELRHLADTFNKLLDQLASTTTSRQEMMSILRSLSELLVVTDHEGTILWTNAAYEAFLRDTNQPQGKLMSEHINWHPGKNNTETGGLEVCYQRTLDAVQRTGLTVLWSRTLYFDEKNNHTGFIYTGQDITATRKTERALKQEQENSEAARQRAEELSLAKSNFLTNMSHEIRTPMNGVLGMISLLLKSKLTTRQRTQATLAQSSARSLLSLINDILDISKIEAHTLNLVKRPFDLVKTLEECGQTLAVHAFEKELELILDLNGIDQRQLYGDSTRLRQVLFNLASNAISFTEQGHVAIKATLTPPHNGERILTINIEDTGRGIAEEKLSTLFDWIQSDKQRTTNAIKSPGLGLPIAYKLIQLMGGELSVSSELGKGSIFTATLPLGSNLPYQPALPKPALENRHALVIECNQASCQATLVALSILGATSDSAASIADALIQCQSPNANDHYDLLMIDARLSTSDNQASIDQLKRILSSKGLTPEAVIFVGNITQDLDADNALENGHYILKPILLAQLANLCVEIFDSASHVTASTDSSNQYLETVPQSHHETEPPLTESLPPPKAAELDESNGHKNTHMPTHTPNGQLTILLVEDNEINQAVTLGILEEYELETIVAKDGKEALTLLKQATSAGRQFHLILMDCQMPNMDGYETTRAIRQGDAGQAVKNIPIIAMTANAMCGDKEKCLTAGMNDYVSKPLEPGELMSALSEWSGKTL
jgi:signal transduction histidine kinase/DNA-binding response OmpR family regulator